MKNNYKYMSLIIIERVKTTLYVWGGGVVNKKMSCLVKAEMYLKEEWGHTVVTYTHTYRHAHTHTWIHTHTYRRDAS